MQSRDYAQPTSLPRLAYFSLARDVDGNRSRRLVVIQQLGVKNLIAQQMAARD